MLSLAGLRLASDLLCAARIERFPSSLLDDAGERYVVRLHPDDQLDLEACRNVTGFTQLKPWAPGAPVPLLLGGDFYLLADSLQPSGLVEVAGRAGAVVISCSNSQYCPGSQAAPAYWLLHAQREGGPDAKR